MRYLIIIIVFLSSINLQGQEKKLWAKSYLNQKAPELIVEKWLTDAPDTEGKFVLIDFWATWCGPCKKAIPELNEYHKIFNEDLVVIGISDETEKKVAKMTRPKMDYYSAIDTKAQLNNLYEVKGIPHCVIINPDGIVVWEGWPHQSGFELTESTIKELIKEYKS